MANDGFDDDLLERMDALVAGLSARYLDGARRDLARLRTLLDQAEALAPEQRTALMQGPVYGLVHDIKGQGGSFGYPLATAIGERLCRRIQGTGAFPDVEMERLRRYAEALERVVAANLAGDGGDEGRALLAGLP